MGIETRDVVVGTSVDAQDTAVRLIRRDEFLLGVSCHHFL
jgi:hypothetical protein